MRQLLLQRLLQRFLIQPNVRRWHVYYKAYDGCLVDKFTCVIVLECVSGCVGVWAVWVCGVRVSMCRARACLIVRLCVYVRAHVRVCFCVCSYVCAILCACCVRERMCLCACARVCVWYERVCLCAYEFFNFDLQFTGDSFLTNRFYFTFRCLKAAKLPTVLPVTYEEGKKALRVYAAWSLHTCILRACMFVSKC